MAASHVETEWYQALAAQYRDRVRWDVDTGLPSCIDMAAGPYTVPGALTDADRLACRLPPLLVHPPGWR